MRPTSRLFTLVIILGLLTAAFAFVQHGTTVQAQTSIRASLFCRPNGTTQAARFLVQFRDPNTNAFVPMTGLGDAAGDFNIVNGNFAGTTVTETSTNPANPAGSEYIITINPIPAPSPSTNVRLIINPGAATSVSGSIPNSSTSQIICAVESVPPTITSIVGARGFSVAPETHVNTDPFNFIVTFSEAVYGFDSPSDYTLTIPNSVSNIPTVSSISLLDSTRRRYLITVDLNQPASITDGLYTLTVNAGDVVDSWANPYAGGDSGSVISDRTRPVVSLSTTAGNPNLSSTIPLTIDVTDANPRANQVAANEIVFVSPPTNNPVWTVSPVSSGTVQYTTTINAVSIGTRNVRILQNTVADLAGNQNLVSNTLQLNYSQPAASSVAFLTTPNGQNGNVGSFTVRVRDNTNNPVPFCNLNLTLQSGTGTLGGTLTAQTNLSGDATFTGTTLSNGGLYTLRATTSTGCGALGIFGDSQPFSVANANGTANLLYSPVFPVNGNGELEVAEGAQIGARLQYLLPRPNVNSFGIPTAPVTVTVDVLDNDGVENDLDLFTQGGPLDTRTFTVGTSPNNAGSVAGYTQPLGINLTAPVNGDANVGGELIQVRVTLDSTDLSFDGIEQIIFVRVYDSGILITPTTLNIGEGSSDTYDVTLLSPPGAVQGGATAPAETITVTLDESTLSLGLNPTTVTFDRSDWDSVLNRTKTVTVNAPAGSSTNSPYTITHAVSTNAVIPTFYQTATADSVTVTVPSSIVQPSGLDLTIDVTGPTDPVIENGSLFIDVSVADTTGLTNAESINVNWSAQAGFEGDVSEFTAMPVTLNTSNSWSATIEIYVECDYTETTDETFDITLSSTPFGNINSVAFNTSPVTVTIENACPEPLEGSMDASASNNIDEDGAFNTATVTVTLDVTSGAVTNPLGETVTLAVFNDNPDDITVSGDDPLVITIPQGGTQGTGSVDVQGICDNLTDAEDPETVNVGFQITAVSSGWSSTPTFGGFSSVNVTLFLSDTCQSVD
jgi:hypothetical protein